MNRHEHRIDCIKAYIRGYLSEPVSEQIRVALTHIHDLAEGVDVADVGAKRPS